MMFGFGYFNSILMIGVLAIAIVFIFIVVFAIAKVLKRLNSSAMQNVKEIIKDKVNYNAAQTSNVTCVYCDSNYSNKLSSCPGCGAKSRNKK
jgi:uncharacterized paraquat-inducible protein A